MIKLEDGRTGLDQRHIAIAERYWDKVIAPDGTMTRSWLVMLLAQVALEGERLTDQPAPTETALCADAGTFEGLGKNGVRAGDGTLCHTCPWNSRAFHPDCVACVAETAPQGAPRCDNPDCDEKCKQLHPDH